MISSLNMKDVRVPDLPRKDVIVFHIFIFERLYLQHGYS